MTGPDGDSCTQPDNQADSDNPGRTPEQRAIHARRAASSPPQTVSTAAPVNTQEAPQTTQDASQQSLDPQANTEVGNVPTVSTAAATARSGVPLMAIGGAPLSRAPDGRLYNPAKGEPPPRVQLFDTPKKQAEAPKSAPPIDLEQIAGIKGLDSIPKGWKELPGNVSLGHEIAWVQSERLRVVIETPRGGIRVDLAKARTPAPSMAALSWLETSIRSYAKFIEVAAKTASSGVEEQEFIRRERMQIAEIDALLAEMEEDEG